MAEVTRAAEVAAAKQFADFVAALKKRIEDEDPFEVTLGRSDIRQFIAIYESTALLRESQPEPEGLVAHLQRQREWSERTFGPGERTAGIMDHIRKELREVEAKPYDLSEWIDVVILALDGAWRVGYTPHEIAFALMGKQEKNEARTWPDWRTAEPGKAIEHDRTGEPEPATVVSDRYEMRECPPCTGTGCVGEKKCKRCNGWGVRLHHRQPEPAATKLIPVKRGICINTDYPGGGAEVIKPDWIDYNGAMYEPAHVCDGSGCCKEAEPATPAVTPASLRAELDTANAIPTDAVPFVPVTTAAPVAGDDEALLAKASDALENWPTRNWRQKRDLVIDLTDGLRAALADVARLTGREDELRRAVAELIGADPETWPDHGNAPLAIAATLALRIKERDEARRNMEFVDVQRVRISAALAAAEQEKEKAVAAARELYEARESRKLIRADPRTAPIIYDPQDYPKTHPDRMKAGTRAATALKRVLAIGRDVSLRARAGRNDV